MSNLMPDRKMLELRSVKKFT